MKRRLVVAAILVVTVGIAILVVINTQSSRVAYHQWRMNAEFNTLFGEPTPVGDGLASYDVTGVDVDQVMTDYQYHRQRLVDLGVLSHLQTEFPRSPACACILNGRSTVRTR